MQQPYTTQYHILSLYICQECTPTIAPQTVSMPVLPNPTVVIPKPTTILPNPTGSPLKTLTIPPNSVNPTSSICFSGRSKVHVKGHGIIEIKDLKIGDTVLTSNGQFSKVYSYGHYNPNIAANYLQIQTDSTTIPMHEPLWKYHRNICCIGMADLPQPIKFRLETLFHTWS